MLPRHSPASLFTYSPAAESRGVVLRLFLGLCVLGVTLMAHQSRALSFSGLEAYKLELENHIDTKIRQAVKSVVSEESYSLSVTVNLKSSEEIKKILPKYDLGSDAGEDDFDGTEDYQFVGDAPTEEETLLPLTKLGLWERKRSASKKNKGDEGSQSYIGYRDFVASIDVNMFVDKSLSDDESLAAERILKGTLSNSEGPLKVEFKKMALLKTVKSEEAKKEAKEGEEIDPVTGEARSPSSEEKEKEKTNLDYLIEFKMPLAILIFTLAVFVLGLLILSNMNKLSLRKMNLVEKQAEREEAAFKAAQFREEEKHLKSQAAIEPMNADEVERKKTEIKVRLSSLIQTQEKELGLMIRRWVLFRGSGAEEGLNFCARHFSVLEINKILEGLNDEERRSWNLALSRPYGPIEERAALAFLETQILVHMISSVPRGVDDLKGLVSQLSLSEVLTLIGKNQEIGALVLNFMQAVQVSKIFEALDRDMVARLSQIAVQVTPDLIRSKAAEIQSAIQQIKQQSAVRSPFVDRLQTILSEITPDKEASVFLAMAGQLERKAMIDVARNHFPADLIPQMPIELLKKSFNAISLVRRAELILAQPKDRQDFLLSIIGGGKSLEMIQDEIDNINLDSAKANLLKRNYELLWKQFINATRSLTKEEVGRGDLDDVIKPWAEGLAQRSRSGARRAA